MASPASSIRSAARATSSAYRRLPIRWRLAGGSAALTLVILCGFAAIVGVLTDRRLHADFSRQVAGAADDLVRSLPLKRVFDQEGRSRLVCATNACPISNLTDYASPQDAVVQIVTLDGSQVRASRGAPAFPAPEYLGRSADFAGYRIETRRLAVTNLVRRAVRPVRAAAVRRRRDRGARALLPGPGRARRRRAGAARRPGHGAARDGADREPHRDRPHDRAHARPVGAAPAARPPRTRSPSWPTRSARCCTRSTSRARETEAALSRQREFVADASHELRTPLTSVLANLELLEEELVRRAARHRRLRAALHPAHAPPGRRPAAARARRRRPRRAARARGPRLGRGRGGGRARAGGARPRPVGGRRAGRRRRRRPRRAAPARAEPDGERGQAHRAGHRRSARRSGGRRRRSSSWSRTTAPACRTSSPSACSSASCAAASDRGGSSGLGLSIVRAVAETHGGTRPAGARPAAVARASSSRSPARPDSECHFADVNLSLQRDIGALPL